MLLDYPNHDDRIRFQEEVDKGSLPENAEIGGLIEIHGDGGRGINWTDGCIALSNKDMDVLYRKVQKGSMITIVGSLRPFKEVFENIDN